MSRARALTAWLGLVAWLTALPLGPAGAQTQLELNERAGRSYAQADAALNRAYERLIAKVSAEGKDALRQAQRAWIAYRDQDCAFATMATSRGSIHPMLLLDCKAELTRERTKRLQAQVDCPEGDVSCGGQ